MQNPKTNEYKSISSASKLITQNSSFFSENRANTEIISKIDEQIPGASPIVLKMLKEVMGAPELAKNIQMALAVNQDFINDLLQNPEKFEDLQQQLNDLINSGKAGMTKLVSTAAAFVKSLNLGSFDYSKLLPLLPILLPAVSAANSTNYTSYTNFSDFTINAGIPAGGYELCPAIYCREGFLSNNSNLTSFSQFSAKVVQAVACNGGKYSNCAIPTPFYDCLSLDRVGNAVLNFFAKGAVYVADATLTCTANSVQYLGWTGQIEATNLPATECVNFQQAMTTEFNACTNSATNTWVIVGSVIGGIFGAALLVALIAMCFALTDCCKPCRKCCDD